MSFSGLVSVAIVLSDSGDVLVLRLWHGREARP